MVKWAWVLSLALACFFRLFWCTGLPPQPSWATCSCFQLLCSWRACEDPWLSVFSAQSTLLRRSTCGKACKPETSNIAAALATAQGPSQHAGHMVQSFIYCSFAWPGTLLYIASGPSGQTHFPHWSAGPSALLQCQKHFFNALALVQGQRQFLHLRALLQDASMNEQDAKENKAASQTETTITDFCQVCNTSNVSVTQNNTCNTDKISVIQKICNTSTSGTSWTLMGLDMARKGAKLSGSYFLNIQRCMATACTYVPQIPLLQGFCALQDACSVFLAPSAGAVNHATKAVL